MRSISTMACLLLRIHRLGSRAASTGGGCWELFLSRDRLSLKPGAKRCRSLRRREVITPPSSDPCKKLIAVFSHKSR